MSDLTLIWVLFLEVLFGLCEGGGGRVGKITPTPCLKLVRIMLETSKVAHKYTPICSFRKYALDFQMNLNDKNFRNTAWAFDIPANRKMHDLIFKNSARLMH